MRTPAFPLAALVLAGFLAGPALAQDPAPVYVQLSYMRVPAGMGAEYVAVERDVWRPIHEERRRRGELAGWSLYGVMYAPPGAPYDYVTANVYSDPSQMSGGNMRAIVEAAHPGADFDALMERTSASREVVHSELWTLVESAQAEGAPGPTGRYLAVNYMAVPPGAGAEYVATEREVWAPVHQGRADAGHMGGWALYGLVLPRGDAMEYNFGTVDYFDDMEAALAGLSWDMVREAHGGVSEADLQAMMDRTEGARSVHKTELWSLIGSLDE